MLEEVFMNLSFYDYMKTFANEEANDPTSRLANIMVKDQSFPKHENNFETISNYLEHEIKYSKLLLIFDEVWQKYQYEL